MIDITKVRRANDLMGVIPTAALKKVAGTEGGEWAGPCPFCGGKDRFRAQPNANDGRWLCRKCTNGKWQDVIDFIMRRDTKDFTEACEYLGAQRVDRADFVPAQPARPSLNPPPMTWQIRATQRMEEFESQLWGRTGERALGWLRHRGLNDKTIKKTRLGFNDSSRSESANLWGLPDEPDEHGKLKEIYIPRGVVIPGLVRRKPWFLKVRRPDGDPKYLQVKGSRPVMYLAETLENCNVAVLTEGEFDASLLLQEIESLPQVGVATLGSAYNGLTVWRHYLKPANLLLVAYHHDDAGEMNASKIARTFPDARLIEIPRLKPGHKDLTDYFCAGGDLKKWIEKIQNDAK